MVAIAFDVLALSDVIIICVVSSVCVCVLLLLCLSAFEMLCHCMVCYDLACCLSSSLKGLPLEASTGIPQA